MKNWIKTWWDGSAVNQRLREQLLDAKVENLKQAREINGKIEEIIELRIQINKLLQEAINQQNVINHTRRINHINAIINKYFGRASNGGRSRRHV